MYKRQPEVLVEDVIAKLRELGPVEVETLAGKQETMEFRLPVELNQPRTPVAAAS